MIKVSLLTKSLEDAVSGHNQGDERVAHVAHSHPIIRTRSEIKNSQQRRYNSRYDRFIESRTEIFSKRVGIPDAGCVRILVGVLPLDKTKRNPATHVRPDLSNVLNQPRTILSFFASTLRNTKDKRRVESVSVSSRTC